MPVEPPADAENGTAPAPRSWFPSLTHTQALLGVVTVVLGIWQGYSTLRISELEARQGVLKSEREWVDAIFAKYVEATTNKDYQIDNRIAHLSVLVVMTDMISDDHRMVKEKLAQAIHSQAEIYRSDIVSGRSSLGASGANDGTASAADGAAPYPSAAAASNASALLSRLDVLQTAAASVAPVASRRLASWSNYDFDVFWCEASANADKNFRLATRIAGLKSLDPDASGRWRVRSLPVDRAQQLAQGREFVIHVEGVTDARERAFAESLVEAMRGERLLERDDQFEILASDANQTRYLISVVACAK